jgi:hypothetical protein
MQSILSLLNRRATNQMSGATTSEMVSSREEIMSAQREMQSQVPAAVALVAAAAKGLSDAEKEALFKQFEAWEVERNVLARAQVRPKKAKSRPPT